MPKKRKPNAVAVTGEQHHRTPRRTARLDPSVIRLLVPIMARLEEAFPTPNYPESQPPTPARQPKMQKIVLKLCSRSTRTNPAAYTRFPPAILWQYPSIVSATH